VTQRALYANCFVPAGVQADALFTDEPAVAAAAKRESGLPVVSPEEFVDERRAHELSAELWRFAHRWFRPAGEDPTVLGGVSVGELAAYEAALAVLMPATRAVLATAAMLERGPVPDRLTVLAPAPVAGRYERHEQLAADAAAHAARELTHERLEVVRDTSSDARNALLRDKYLRTRDPDPLLAATGSRRGRLALLRAANLLTLGRRRDGPTLLVVDYNPTLAFSRSYVADPNRRMQLVRWIGRPDDVLPTVRAGDRVDGPPLASARAVAAKPLGDLGAASGIWPAADYEVSGVRLWPVLAPRLLELLDRYGAFVAAQAPPLRRRLTRQGIDAVLVPFDSSPPVRLLIAVARSMGIPSFVLNDGYKADEVQIEGFSTDVALAWSSAVAENYFVRHPGRTVVVGNPKVDAGGARWRGLHVERPRVLVGSFTFSPIDLNCRRADAERFLGEVLEGISAALPAVRAEVVVKLHPADEPAHYLELLRSFPELEIELTTQGDVVETLGASDIYVTTYSTSLLEAAASMPVIYYRVNRQRLGPPFESDGWLGPRTAESAEQLARLLADRALLDQPPPAGWSERYLGPPDAVAKIAAEIESVLSGRTAADRGHAAPDVARRLSPK
jgi:hypothetical protein